MQQKNHHTCSIGLYIGHRKYWNFQSEAKVEQIIAIVTTRSVSCCSYFHFRLMLCFLIFSKTKFLTRSLIYVHRFRVSQSKNGSNDTINRKFIVTIVCLHSLSSVFSSKYCYRIRMDQLNMNNIKHHEKIKIRIHK